MYRGVTRAGLFNLIELKRHECHYVLMLLDARNQEKQLILVGTIVEPEFVDIINFRIMFSKIIVTIWKLGPGCKSTSVECRQQFGNVRKLKGDPNCFSQQWLETFHGICLNTQRLLGTYCWGLDGLTWSIAIKGFQEGENFEREKIHLGLWEWVCISWSLR